MQKETLHPRKSYKMNSSCADILLFSAYCKDGLAFRLGSERNDCTRAPVGHASTPQFSFVISSHLPPPLSPSLSTRPPAQNKLRTNHFPSHSHSLPLSLFHLICFPFSLYLRQRRSILSHSSTALVHPRTFSNTFLLTFADFFLSFFYIFPERSAQRRRVYLPIPDPASSYHRIRLPSVGTHVFKLPPHQGRH